MMGVLYEDIKGPFVWTFGSVIRVIQLMWKLKKHLFRITWIITYCIQNISRICPATLHHLFCICFLFRSVLSILPKIQCWWNSHAKTSEKNPKDLRNQADKWITKVHLFGYEFLQSLWSTDHWSIFQNKWPLKMSSI